VFGTREGVGLRGVAQKRFVRVVVRFFRLRGVDSTAGVVEMDPVVAAEVVVV
jgi:hypothetical protein